MINENAFQPQCILHDFRFFSFFYGEPFLTNNVLWFCDGERARVVGYDANLCPVAPSAFFEIANEAAKRFSVTAITAESPQLLSLGRQLPHYSRHVLDRPRQYENELLLTLSRYRETTRHRQCVGRAKKRGLYCMVTTNRSSTMSLEHWRLLRQHIESFEPTPFYKAEYLAAIFFLFNDPATTLFDVFLSDQLKGFALVRKIGELALMHFITTGSDKTGVSDLIYYSAIQHSLTTSAKILSLGLTPTKGLSNYKHKWQPDIALPGTFEIIWVKGSVNRASNNLWLTKFLRRLL